MPSQSTYYVPSEQSSGNTHYAVIVFTGDPASEHDAEDLRGQPPSLNFIACGSEQFCWDSVTRWVEKHPLREWESVEVLKRDPALVRQPSERCS